MLQLHLWIIQIQQKDPSDRGMGSFSVCCSRLSDLSKLGFGTDFRKNGQSGVSAFYTHSHLNKNIVRIALTPIHTAEAVQALVGMQVVT